MPPERPRSDDELFAVIVNQFINPTFPHVPPVRLTGMRSSRAMAAKAAAHRRPQVADGRQRKTSADVRAEISVRSKESWSKPSADAPTDNKPAGEDEDGDGGGGDFFDDGAESGEDQQ